MQRHILIHKISTYFNIGDVEEIAYATSKRQLKRKQKPKTNATQTPLCGN
jgi:hypothetical protein